MTVGGVVLAGGTGRRMGGPKAGLELDGVTLVERAIAMLRAAGCDPVLVADDGDEGPLAALRDPLARLGSDDVVILACDLPLAEPVVRRLRTGTVAVDPDGRMQPLCSRLDRSRAVAALAAALDRGERRMSALTDALNPEPVAATADELLNVNTPDDLARAAVVLRRKG